MKKHIFLAGFCVGYAWHASKGVRQAVVSGCQEGWRRSATRLTKEKLIKAVYEAGVREGKEAIFEESRDTTTGETSIVVRVETKAMAEHILGVLMYAIEEFGFFSRNDLRNLATLPPLEIGGDLGWDSPEDFWMAYREDQWILVLTQPRRQESRG